MKRFTALIIFFLLVLQIGNAESALEWEEGATFLYGMSIYQANGESLSKPAVDMRFMNVCGVMLQFYGVHMMYWKILNCFFMDTIYEVNRHMRDAGFPAMTEGIE